VGQEFALNNQLSFSQNSLVLFFLFITLLG
jgi:hypothetical protein